MVPKRKLEYGESSSSGKSAKKFKADPKPQDAISPSSIVEAASKISVRAVVTSLSLMRNRRFTAELADERQQLGWLDLISTINPSWKL